MKSIACISSSVRAACQHTSACLPLNRAFIVCSPVGRCSNVDFACRRQEPCVTGVRNFHGTHVNTAVVQQVSAEPLLSHVPMPGKREDDLTVYQLARRVPPTAALIPAPSAALRPAPHLSQYSPYTKPQGEAAALVNMQSLFEGEVIPELCSRLADLPSSDRAEGLATLLGACVEFGLDAHSPLVRRLTDECLQLLSKRDIEVRQLCHLGEVARTLEGGRSGLVTEVLDAVGVVVEDDVISPSEAVRLYSLLALCHDPASQQQQTRTLYTLHRHTKRLVHQLTAGQVSEILRLLVKLQQRRVGRAASLKSFSSFCGE